MRQRELELKTVRHTDPSPSIGGSARFVSPVELASNRNSRLLCCVVFAALLTAIVLHYSFRHGRLCTIPSFDDVGYMADGMQRLETLYGPGHVRAFLAEYRKQPPHSPYSDLMAMAAFAIFGPHDWAPYVANGFLLLVFFIAADRLLENIRPWQRAACLLLLASVPFMAMAAHEFRPDPAVSLATAIGLLMAITRPLVRSPLRHKVAVGAIFGVAMLIKPPVFPATTIFFFTAVSLGVLCDWLTLEEKPTSRELANTFIACVVPFALIPLPHYYINGRGILIYINDVLFGRYRTSYEFHGNRLEELLYYFTGRGGNLMLGVHGVHLAIFLGILLIGAIATIFLRQREDLVRGGAMFAALVLSAAIPITNHTKSEFFGLTMDILLALSALYVLGRLVAGARGRGLEPVGSTLIATAAVVGVLFFQWPTRHGNFNTDWMVNLGDMTNGIYNGVFDHTVAPKGPVLPSALLPAGEKTISHRPRVMFTAIGDINPSLFQFMAFRDLRYAMFYAPVASPRIEDYLAVIDDADFVIIGEQGSQLIADFLPGFNVQDELLARLRHRPEFRELGYFPFIRTGKGFALFQRVDYAGWLPREGEVSGVGAFEGPLAQVNGRILFWGMGPVSKFKISPRAPGPCELCFEARNSFANQIITVKLDGQVVAKENASDDSKFTSHTIPLTLTAGPHDLDLEYTAWEVGKSRPVALLYRAMRIQNK